MTVSELRASQEWHLAIPVSEEDQHFIDPNRFEEVSFLPEFAEEALYYLADGGPTPLAERDIKRLQGIKEVKESLAREKQLHYLRFGFMTVAMGVAIGFVWSSYGSNTKITSASFSTAVGGLVSSLIGSYANKVKNSKSKESLQNRNVVIQKISERYKRMAQVLISLSYTNPNESHRIANALFKPEFYDYFTPFDLQEEEVHRIVGSLYQAVCFVRNQEQPKEAQLDLVIRMEELLKLYHVAPRRSQRDQVLTAQIG